MKTFISLVICLCCYIPVQGAIARVLYYDKPLAGPEKVYMYVDNKLHGEVDLPKFQFGEDIEIKSKAKNIQIVFSPYIIEEGQELPVGLPSVSVRRNLRKFLIVVVEDQDNPLLPIKSFVVNANENYFGNSDFLFLNMTPNYIGGTFGEKIIKVAPSKIHIAKMSEYQGEFLDVKLDYIRPDDSERKRRWMIYQGWRVLSDRRTLVFCYVPEGRTSMKYFATQVKNM